MLTYKYIDDDIAPRLEIDGISPMVFDGTQKRIRRYMAMQHREGRMHEPDFSFALIEVIKTIHPKVIFDIGAFIGYFTVMSAAASAHDTRIYSFEMNDASYKLVCANIVANKHLAPSRIFPICAGVAAKSELAKKISILGFSMFEGWDEKQFEDLTGKKDLSELVKSHVDLIALDDFCRSTGVYPDLIKMDIEGWECAAIDGARDLLAHHMPTLLIEIHAEKKLAEFGYSQRSFLEALQGYGYEMFLMSDHKQRGEDVVQFTRLTPEAIAAHGETRNTAVIALSQKHAASLPHFARLAMAKDT